MGCEEESKRGENYKLEVCHTVTSAKLPLKDKLCYQDLERLKVLKWRPANEERNPVLIKKFDNISVCLNFNGSMLIHSRQAKEAKKVFEKILQDFKESKIKLVKNEIAEAH